MTKTLQRITTVIFVSLWLAMMITPVHGAEAASPCICYEGGASADKWDPLVQEQIACVEEDILNAFQEHGWTICVTAYDIASTYYGGPSMGQLAGLTYSVTNTVYVENRENAITNALLHEIGHVIDLESGENGMYSSDSPAFQDIWREEAPLFQANAAINEKLTVRDYDISSTTEYFAEFFMRYCWDNSIQASFPLTYAFMEGCIGQFLDSSSNGQTFTDGR